MTRIRLYDHPLAPSAPKVFLADSLGQWLLDYYGAIPSVRVQVFAGEPSEETEITGDVAAILAGERDEYVVLQSPGGGDTLRWINPTWYVSYVVGTKGIQGLFSQPDLPGNIRANRTQSSPNNSLGNRENQVRLLERVEDIYGTVKSIPSLMMPTYRKYLAHQQYEYGYYCVGRGYHDVADLRDGETPIADITGASAAVYAPFTSPNSGDAPQLLVGSPIIDDIVTVARANEVDGITLRALNQIQLPAGVEFYTFTPNGGGDLISQKNKNPNFSAVCGAGDQVAVSMTPKTLTAVGSASAVAPSTFNGSSSLFSAVKPGSVITVSGFADPANNGTFTVATKPSTSSITVTSTALVNESASEVSVATDIDYSGTYVIAESGDGFIRLTTSTFHVVISPAVIFSQPTATLQIAGKSEWTDWVVQRTPTRAETWLNVIAQAGMFKDNGGKSAATVAFEIQIEQLDPGTLAPTGTVETITGAISGAVTDERAETIERATAWTGPARVRMRRTTPYDYAFEGTVQDEIKWVDLYAVSPVAALHFGNKTTIHTITRATTRATAVKSRQLNCIASRLLPTYDGAAWSGAFDADGRHVSGTIAATSRLIDILAAVTIDPLIGRRTLAELDVAQIWGVQQALDAWHPECGRFDYTLDSDGITYEETIHMIANAGFCAAYRQNGKIRLAFERAASASVALFTHRNKRPRSETLTRSFANDADFDGIEMVYVDPDSTISETIRLPLDGSARKPKKIEIPGIRSFVQAWLRANREYAKIRWQRVSIELETLQDARLLLPNSRIDIVDNTRFRAGDGEVVAQSGLELTLSQPVDFVPSEPHSIVLMHRDGSSESLGCTAGNEPNRVVLASPPSEAIVTTPGGADGVRTIYSIAADSRRGAMAYLVQEIDLGDGQYPKLTAINYAPEYYAADYAAIPAKDTVIN